MKRKQPARRAKRPEQSGAAMLIAIFALLLISVVAIALVVSSGTDSSLAGNYRTSTSAYYAGIAGLEEARGRLLWKNPNYINITNSYSNLLNSSGVPTWGLTQVMYITNPNAGEGEVVDPTGGNPANYPDTEYGQEFSWGLSGATVYPPVPSVSPVAGLPGPSYKWVRINAITEASLNIDVDGNGVKDAAAVLFYDPAHIDPSTGKPVPGLRVSTPASPPVPPTPTSVQALEVTVLAVAPNGGRRVLQYVVAPLIISPDAGDQNYPATLTLDGNNVIFQLASGANYFLRGVDSCNPPPPPALPGAVPSLGLTNSGDYGTVFSLVNQTSEKPIYPGAPLSATPPPYQPATPSLANVNPGIPNVGLRQSWLQPAPLGTVMQDIVNSADVIITGPATGTDISNRAPLMSASNPMTIVVNGDLNLNGWHNIGYGLLLVTGTLNYDPDASWDGIVLVVGQGIFSSSKNGNGVLNGALFVAKTRDSSGNLLPGMALGSAFYGSQTSFGSNPGYGINYNSCFINSAKGPLTYKVLSFHEVPLPL